MDKAFRTFLIACGRASDDCDYWDFTEAALDNYLAKFWSGARKTITVDVENAENEEDDPELKSRMYSTNSIKNF